MTIKRLFIFLGIFIFLILSLAGCSSSGGSESSCATLSCLVTSGLDSLSQGNVTEAKDYFKAAVDNYPGDSTNDGDTARFFYAFTRIAGINLNSDGNSADLNSMGDILDRADCSAGGRNIINLELTMTCPGLSSATSSATIHSSPSALASDFPTGTQMQTFVYNVIRPELEAALVNLNGVSASFTRTWTNPIDSKSYISDYADVLVLRAAIKGALAAIHMQHTYNLNADIDVEVNDTDNTVQTFLSRNTDFLKLMAGDYSTSRNTAKTYLGQVADDLSAAIDKIKTRNTAAYFINLVDMTTPEIDDAKAKIASGKSSLTGQTTIDDRGTVSTADDIIINLSFFFAGLDLRALLPAFTGNTPGGLPDPTMGGIIVGGTDTNGNGIPDILE